MQFFFQLDHCSIPVISLVAHTSLLQKSVILIEYKQREETHAKNLNENTSVQHFLHPRNKQLFEKSLKSYSEVKWTSG